MPCHVIIFVVFVVVLVLVLVLVVLVLVLVLLVFLVLVLVVFVLVLLQVLQHVEREECNFYIQEEVMPVVVHADFLEMNVQRLVALGSYLWWY
jgi:hypothetical protein